MALDITTTVYNRYQRQKRVDLKAKLVEEAGGCCSRCGYDTFLSALEFHHTGVKEGHVSQMIHRAANSRRYDRQLLYNELKQCVLLCSNCHRGLHGGEWKDE